MSRAAGGTAARREMAPAEPGTGGQTRRVTAIVIAIALCVILFALGVIAPRLSRKAEHDVDRAAGKAEQHENPQTLPGRAARKSTEMVDTVADKASEAGRGVRGE